MMTFHSLGKTAASVEVLKDKHLRPYGGECRMLECTLKTSATSFINLNIT